MIVLIFIALTWGLQNGLQFVERQYREVACKQQEERKENSDGSDKHTDIDGSRFEFSPSGRKVIAVDWGHDNYETLEPHTNINDDWHDEREHEVGAQFLKPE